MNELWEPLLRANRTLDMLESSSYASDASMLSIMDYLRKHHPSSCNYNYVDVFETYELNNSWTLQHDGITLHLDGLIYCENTNTFFVIVIESNINFELELQRAREKHTYFTEWVKNHRPPVQKNRRWKVFFEDDDRVLKGSVTSVKVELIFLLYDTCTDGDGANIFITEGCHFVRRSLQK
jgi:hypothetical protein